MSSFDPLLFSTDDARWEAVVTRDIRAEDLFVYGVTTSDIFCRPTCPARRPNRKHVVFFTTSEAAAAAGYRACHRCKPDVESLHQRHLIMIQRACMLIEGAEVPPPLKSIAGHVGLSRFYFHRLFKRYVGITPKEYSAMCQLRRLETLLEQGTSIIEAIYDAGFSSTSRIYEKTARDLGMTPAKFKAGASGLSICHTIVESPLGQLLVATTDKGICTIEFGSSSSELKQRLMARFPGAKLVESRAGLKRALSQIISLIAPPQPGADLPLALRGTALQRRIRKALQRMPHDPAGSIMPGHMPCDQDAAPDLTDPTASAGQTPPRAREAPASNPITHTRFNHGANHDD